jgi:heme/copper-type cytochrome/quinol oxidase subunit 4
VFCCHMCTFLLYCYVCCFIVQYVILLMFRVVFWDILSCKIIVDNHFTRQYIPDDNSEHHTRRRENLKSHMLSYCLVGLCYLSCVCFLFCMVAFYFFCSLFLYCVFVLLFISSSSYLVFVFFLYLYTEHCHRVETQLQLIIIIITIIIIIIITIIITIIIINYQILFRRATASQSVIMHIMYKCKAKAKEL